MGRIRKHCSAQPYLDYIGVSGRERKEMSKLKEEELLSILTAVFSYYLSGCNYKETATKFEEAHEQIKEMIKNRVA